MDETTTKVYHALDPSYGFGENPSWPNEYALVATVQTGDPDVAYAQTNSVDSSWWNNQGVVPNFIGEGCRSTSVGDVLVMQSGKELRCEHEGWSVVGEV